ncbi:MAG: radical SAM family heme chaperone HemW, partial [Myxococcota bacterium]
MDAGLYVHVPYCRHRCPYCDFNVWIDKHAPWAALADATVGDIGRRAAEFPYRFRSVYFGGGTPSLAPNAFFARVLEAADQVLGLQGSAEVTMEIEPDTISAARLRELVALGVNRASLGWQSSHDRLLKVLGRGHRADAAFRMFEDARNAGFDSVSIDLMFAVPGQTLAELDADLDRIVALSPDHVSLYALTFEPDTEFERRRRRGRLVPTEDDLEAEMMEHIESRLISAGYHHYEVSSYAKAGHAAVHNSGYWS